MTPPDPLPEPLHLPEVKRETCVYPESWGWCLDLQDWIPYPVFAALEKLAPEHGGVWTGWIITASIEFPSAAQATAALVAAYAKSDEKKETPDVPATGDPEPDPPGPGQEV